MGTLLLIAACGEAPQEPVTHIHAPVSLGLELSSCVDDAFNGLEAELRVGGYNAPCPLEVDTTDLTVSGTCPEILPFKVRPLVLVWRLPAPPQSGKPPAILAYHVTYVDLTRERLADLPRDTSSQEVGIVTVDFVDDGETGVLLYDPDQLDIIPDIKDATTDLDTALVFAEMGITSDHPAGPSTILNADAAQGDVCPNLVEACAGRLYNDDVETQYEDCLPP